LRHREFIVDRITVTHSSSESVGVHPNEYVDDCWTESVTV